MFQKNKIFCISTQRSGTTSVGDFFRLHHYKVAGWPESSKNNWDKSYFDGDYNSIFESKDFKKSRVFEDGPWGVGQFYKYLFHKFKDARFVHFTRDPDKWFDSMLSHSKGRTIGNTLRHCYNYSRETEYFNLMGKSFHYDVNKVDNLLELNETHRQHYIDIYINRNKHLQEFFKVNDKFNERFIHLELEDKNKWNLLGLFFGIEVAENLVVHSNKSPIVK